MNLKDSFKFAVHFLAANFFALVGVLTAFFRVLLKAGEPPAGCVRESANFFVARSRFLMVVGVLSALLVSGCESKGFTRGERMGFGYQWACTGKCEVSFSQADAKCTAQVNAISASQLDRYLIKYQCLAGEGYEAVECALTAPGCTPCKWNLDAPLPDVCW